MWRVHSPWQCGLRFQLLASVLGVVFLAWGAFGTVVVLPELTVVNGYNTPVWIATGDANGNNYHAPGQSDMMASVWPVGVSKVEHMPVAADASGLSYWITGTNGGPGTNVAPGMGTNILYSGTWNGKNGVGGGPYGGDTWLSFLTNYGSNSIVTLVLNGDANVINDGSQAGELTTLMAAVPFTNNPDFSGYFLQGVLEGFLFGGLVGIIMLIRKGVRVTAGSD